MSAPVVPLTPVAAASVLDDLLAGNARFRNGVSVHCDDRVELRLSQLDAQRPMVAVLSCADSRVDPDIVFDTPLGGVFSVRIAGALATDEAIASLRFAVDHLGVRTVVVLGHDACGAVEAATSDAALAEHLDPLIVPIRRAVANGRGTTDPVWSTTLAQAQRVADHVTGCDRDAVATTVVAARYHPATGAVEFTHDVRTAPSVSPATPRAPTTTSPPPTPTVKGTD